MTRIPSELQKWIDAKTPHVGQVIDNGDGQVVTSKLGITSRMTARQVREAAEVLGLDVDEVRTKDPNTLLAELRALQ